jgi:hypothetical protein
VRFHLGTVAQEIYRVFCLNLLSYLLTNWFKKVLRWPRFVIRKELCFNAEQYNNKTMHIILSHCHPIKTTIITEEFVDGKRSRTFVKFENRKRTEEYAIIQLTYMNNIQYDHR